MPFETANQLMTKKMISKMIDTVYRGCGQKETVIFCDRIMDLGFKHACPRRHLVRQGRHGDPGRPSTTSSRLPASRSRSSSSSTTTA